MGCLKEFYKSLSLYFTKMCFKILNFFRRKSVFLQVATKGLQLCWFWWCFLKLLQLNDCRPSSSSLRGIYRTILKLAHHALFKMVRYVLLRPLRPELEIQLEQFKEASSKPGQLKAISYCGNKLQMIRPHIAATSYCGRWLGPYPVVVTAMLVDKNFWLEAIIATTMAPLMLLPLSCQH
jgi:hypothetical protein